MPGKTCHDVSGDKNIDWQLADGKGESSFGILNKMTTPQPGPHRQAMQALRTVEQRRRG